MAGQLVLIESVRRTAISGSHAVRLTIGCREVAEGTTASSATVHILRKRSKTAELVQLHPTADPGPDELPGGRIDRLRAKVPVLFALAQQAVLGSRQKADAELITRLARLRADDSEDRDASVSPVVKIVPAAQRRSGKVMRGEWADPDGGAKSWKRGRDVVCGMKRVDQIVAQKSRNALITDLHVRAANAYRMLWERGPGGSMPGRDNSNFISRSSYVGSGGPTDRQLDAIRRWVDVQSIFNDIGRSMLLDVVLEGQDVSGWSRRKGWNRHHATGYLIALLDRLVAHFDIERDDPEDQDGMR